MSGGVAQLETTLEDASSILLLAPAESEFDDEACTDLLTRTSRTTTNVLSVTLAESPDDRIAVWRREVSGCLPNRVVIVDARRERRTDSASERSQTPSSVAVDDLPPDVEPVDIALAVARRIGAWESSPESTALCLHSLSVLFDSFDTADVVSLVSGLNRLCESADATGHHHLDSTTVNEETLATLRPLYDAVVEHVPNDGWMVTRAPDDAVTPSFRRSRAPPGGTAGTDPDGTETVPVPYSFDQILDLISAARRRTLLYYLKDQGAGTLPLEDVVDAVVGRERSIPARDPPDSWEDAQMSLIHVHLPKLAELGIVDYDPERSVVEHHGNPALESFVRYLETLELG